MSAKSPAPSRTMQILRRLGEAILGAHKCAGYSASAFNRVHDLFDELQRVDPKAYRAWLRHGPPASDGSRRSPERPSVRVQDRCGCYRACVNIHVSNLSSEEAKLLRAVVRVMTDPYFAEARKRLPLGGMVALEKGKVVWIDNGESLPEVGEALSLEGL